MHAQHCDADQARARLRADRHQQGGENQRGGKQHRRFTLRENCAVARHPDNQRDHRDGNGGQGGAFVEARIVLHQRHQRAVSPARKHRLDPGRDDDRGCRKHHHQSCRFQPQLRSQRQRQERGEEQAFPDPVPLFRRGFREIRRQCRKAAPQQQGDDQPLAQGEMAALLVIEQDVSGKRRDKAQHRKRDAGDDAITHLLRRDDIDIDIKQHPQERAAKTHRHHRCNKGQQDKITHRACSPGLSARAFPAAHPRRPLHPDRRAASGASRPARISPCVSAMEK